MAIITIKTASPGFKTFLIVWFGQLVSLTGSGLTGFALGVWVFLTTGSVTKFALISLATALPAILFSPIAGALVDRWDRRVAMMVSDTGSGICSLLIALLLFAGRLEVWHIYILMGISSTFSAFQWPAFSAATTLLVPKEQYGRASGMSQMAEAVGMILSPMIAGALVGLIQVQGVILIDFATFLFAMTTLLFVRIPRPQVSAERKAKGESLWQDVTYGWKYITARPGLLGLLLYFAVGNFFFSLAEVLFTPLVLSFSTTAVLGVLMSIVGIGMLAGSLVMSAWGGPKKRINLILLLTGVQGLMLTAFAPRPLVVLYGVAIFVVFFSTPIINGCSQAIWMSKIAPDVQGRVFSTRRMIAWSVMPLSYLMAGPLADRVFEPLMAVNGPLAGNIGQMIGTGSGRGIALLFIVLSVLTLVTALAGISYRPLRTLEVDLPDVIAEPVPQIEPVKA